MEKFNKSSDEIEFYIKKYRDLDEKKDREGEMRVLTKLIELDPRCETPYKGFYFNHYYNRAVVYDYLEQYDDSMARKAIADYTKAIEINPKHYLAWGNRGVCYSDLGDFDAAISDLEQSLKIEPQSIFIVTIKAILHKRGEARVRRCLEKNADHPGKRSLENGHSKGRLDKNY